MLNTLKAIPTYARDSLKANDPNIALTLTKTSEDSLHRPTYQWLKNGDQMTDSYADTPILITGGEKTYSQLMTAMGNPTNFGAVSSFRLSENGGAFSAYADYRHPSDTPVKAKGWVLEVFAPYDASREEQCYDIICYEGEPPKDKNLIDMSTITTDYPEAVQLLANIGFMNLKDTDWKKPITAAEANKVLQALYDGPGFVDPWTPGYSGSGKITGASFISKALITIGWNYNNDVLFSAYNHLEKGLNKHYDASGALTREQAAQIVLNTLKAIPTYARDALKANDPNIALTLAKTGEDSLHRPTYQWLKNGDEMTDPYADSPVLIVVGGASYSDLMTALGNPGNVNLVASFRTSESGGSFSAYTDRQHPDNELVKSEGWVLEIYEAYDASREQQCYSLICYKGKHPEAISFAVDRINIDDIDTSYPEAVELLSNMHYMDADDTNWKKPITAAEANKVLQALYDGPGFVDEWSPNYSDSDNITGENFTSKALKTVAWSYNYDSLFTTYNHLEKGLDSRYSVGGVLTREQAAQIILNTLKVIPTYNRDQIKGNDSGIGLSIVKTGTDELGRPSYKWTLTGKDITRTYADTPVAVIRGGVSWSGILNAVGDVGTANIVASFRYVKNGKVSDYTDHKHPDSERFMEINYALEIYQDYEATRDEYGYTIICYMDDTMKVEPAEYNGGGDVTMTFPISLSRFKNYVVVDGKVVPPAYYTVEEKDGKLLVTLKQEYLNKLSISKHTVGVVSDIGVIKGELTVNAVGENPPDEAEPVDKPDPRPLESKPVKSENGLMLALGIGGGVLLLLAALTVILLFVYKRKKKKD